MRIIREGKLPEEKRPDRYRGNCHHCGAVVEYVQEELMSAEELCTYGFVTPHARCSTKGCPYPIPVRKVITR